MSQPRTPKPPASHAATDSEAAHAAVTDDAQLFRLSQAGVTPLKPYSRIAPAQSAKPLIPNSQAIANDVADTLSDHIISDEPINEYLSNGLNRMTLRKLRRGTWPPQDSLDLHGLNTDEARKLLLEFLHHATQHAMRCVAVIHGKGQHNETRTSILKSLTRHWLTQHAHVLAFCEAPHHAGGAGAVWVLLKNLPAQE